MRGMSAIPHHNGQQLSVTGILFSICVLPGWRYTHHAYAKHH